MNQTGIAPYKYLSHGKSGAALGRRAISTILIPHCRLSSTSSQQLKCDRPSGLSSKQDLEEV
jgi:hypothetical protein